MHFLIKVLLVLLKYLFPELELIVELILLIIDERNDNMDIVLNGWYKRTYVVGVTLVTYIFI